MTETTFLTITPRTRPASEFHSTRSPRLNAFGIRLLIIVSENEVMMQYQKHVNGFGNLPCFRSRVASRTRATESAKVILWAQYLTGGWGHFGPTSVLSKGEINDALPRKRPQKRH